MDLRLEGRTAVVTGASKGIGLEAVKVLAAEGVRVFAAARSAQPGLGPEVSAVAVDLTTADGVRELAESAGDVDILVNNLGGVMPAAMAAPGFLDIDDQTWAQTYELNFFATLRVTRALLPGLLRRRGVVVNVSSIGAVAAYRPIDYGTAKAALNNLSKGLAEEFGDRGLRVLTVSPGPTRTQNWADPAGYAGQLAERQGVSLEDFLSEVPAAMGITTGRLTEPEEIATLIAFLASGRSGNLTGAHIVADGGVIKTM